MTAFTRKEDDGSWGHLTLELRSVNHRYLETTLRLPEELRALEPRLRERIGERLGRGKVDCNMRYEAPQLQAGEVVVNKEFAQGLAHASREVDSMLYNPAPVSSMDVLKWPGVLQTPAPDLEKLAGAVIALLDSALEDLVATREREGDKLKGLIEQRCDAVAEVAARVRQALPAIQQRLRERLLARLSEIGSEVGTEPDSGRLEQEMVYLAQRMDVDEELDRLETHLEEVRRVLGEEQPVGRRLDFLMQELNREANTLGSKSADAETTRASVDLKVLIEQMREQVQNIE
ncbi:MAG: YicC family protein [Gammaproteobacteria bacterium]